MYEVVVCSVLSCDCRTWTLTDNETLTYKDKLTKLVVEHYLDFLHLLYKAPGLATGCVTTLSPPAWQGSPQQIPSDWSCRMEVFKATLKKGTRGDLLLALQKNVIFDGRKDSYSYDHWSQELNVIIIDKPFWTKLNTPIVRIYAID